MSSFLYIGSTMVCLIFSGKLEYWVNVHVPREFQQSQTKNFKNIWRHGRGKRLPLVFASELRMMDSQLMILRRFSTPAKLWNELCLNSGRTLQRSVLNQPGS